MNHQSSGTTTGLQSFDFGNVPARYVRVVGINVTGSGRKTSKQGVGVSITGAAHVEIDQVEASGFQRAGIEFRGTSDLKVTNVHARGNAVRRAVEHE